MNAAHHPCENSEFGSRNSELPPLPPGEFWISDFGFAARTTKVSPALTSKGGIYPAPTMGRGITQSLAGRKRPAYRGLSHL